MMKTLTIFTPAYNRAHTLDRTYKSMCNQTNHDFEWLVIDDGSVDNTRALVLSYLVDVFYVSDNEFYGNSKDATWLKVHYIYQQNQGMHGAHNTAYDNINTELNTCIDSDDYMPNDAVEKILDRWSSISEEERKLYAGLVALDVDSEKMEVIGTLLPTSKKSTTINAFYQNGGQGDKKLIYRTDVIKSVPKYPIFAGEKYVSLGYKYRLVDQHYELLILNEAVCIVDYQMDGSSHSMYKQYWTNPKGWAFSRKIEMQYTNSLTRKFLVCGHYVYSCIRSKNRYFLSDSPCKLLTFLSIPLGVLMYFYIKGKVKHNVTFKL